MFDAITSSILNSNRLVDPVSKDLGKKIGLLNVDGPYKERRPLWENLENLKVF